MKINDNDKYNRKMTSDQKEAVLHMHSIGKLNKEIANTIGYTSSAVRIFLKKNDLISNKPKKRDRSRPCKMCGKVFTPKYDDGLKKNKYTNCSTECGIKSSSLSKIKYTSEDIDIVINLKKQLKTNADISIESGVDINKIKEIVKKYNLELTPEQSQSNAYRKKLEKNPNAMRDMRDAHMTCPTHTFNTKLNNIVEHLENPNNKHGIPYFCSKENMNANSFRNSLHLRGLSHLIGAQSSKGEDFLAEFVIEYLPKDTEVQRGNRKILKGKEIDIYIPSLNLGIEYCGLYWHNELSPRPRLKDYHYSKMTMSNEQGIRLITIFEDEWQNREKQVKNFLKSIIATPIHKVYARKCEIKEVDKQITKDFLEANHIQGKTMFKVSFGLYLEGELLGLVTGNTHHRQKGDTPPFVLNRLVFKDGVQVVGGASKLLKKLIDYARESGYNRLISWSDNRWSEGNVYMKTGFELTENLKPDYSYFDSRSGDRVSKQSCQKKNLIKKGAVGSMDNTETELAASLGLYKIWDCGKKRWEINLN